MSVTQVPRTLVATELQELQELRELRGHRMPLSFEGLRCTKILFSFSLAYNSPISVTAKTELQLQRYNSV